MTARPAGKTTLAGHGHLRGRLKAEATPGANATGVKWFSLLLLALVVAMLLKRFLSGAAPSPMPSPRPGGGSTASLNRSNPRMNVNDDIYQTLLDRAQPLGLLVGESAETLRAALHEEDDDEELEEFFADDPTGCLTEAVSFKDPNSLINPAEKAEGVARWQPPLIRHLGYRGAYDWDTQTVTFYRADQQVLQARAAAPCHVAEVWNQILRAHEFEMLNLELGTDDHYFLVVPLETGERIRKERLLRLAAPCPRE